MNDPKEVAIEDLGREPEAKANQTPPEPAFIEPDGDPVSGLDSGGQCVGNRIDIPAATIRSGRRTNPPSYLKDYCPQGLMLGGPQVYLP